jgi:KDO2-lipid IV(A) lauroyltransferase
MSSPGREARPPHAAGLYHAPAFALGARLGAALPLRWTRALAGFAGTLYAATHPARVDLVHRNLRLLDPTLPRSFARRVYAEFAQTLADYFYLGTQSPGTATRIVARVTGHEHLEAARRLGRGGIVVTAHFGLFELGGLMLTQAGLRSTVLTFPEPTPALTAWRAEFRRRWGADTLEIGRDPFAFIEIAARLRRGEFIATLVDRPTPGSDVPVRFPGGMTRFSTGILLLAAHGGCPVIPALMAREADGTYHSRVFPALEIRDRGSREETLRHYTQELADIFVPVLREHPEQWYQFVPLGGAVTASSAQAGRSPGADPSTR